MSVLDIALLGVAGVVVAVVLGLVLAGYQVKVSLALGKRRGR